ncbi:hypothetical protein HK104_004124 [Borealophlyctis nickersoniae]|nr:hypothetical protein HK104_004124 [Borealophlyctis nickersoniae]
MPQRTTRTTPLPPELLRQVVLVTDQRTVLTLRYSSKLCKLFADEVILFYSARHPENIKIILSTLVDAQTPSPATTLTVQADAQTPSPAATPPVQSVEDVGSQARFDLKRRTVTVDLVLAPRNRTVPSYLTWLPKHINLINELSMDMSDFLDGVIRLQNMRSRIRNVWRVVMKHGGYGAVFIRSLRIDASAIGTQQLGYQRSVARLQRSYNKAAGAGFGTYLRVTERFAPFFVPIGAASQTLTLTAKGRAVIRARTRRAPAGDGIPWLTSGTIIRHPRRVHDEDQLQHGGGGGGGGDDECRGGNVRIVMAGVKRREKMEVLGFRMEMNVASALFLGGFDGTKASVDPSTAVTVST